MCINYDGEGWTNTARTTKWLPKGKSDTLSQNYYSDYLCQTPREFTVVLSLS